MKRGIVILINMLRFKRGNCLSVFKIAKKELVCHIANLLVLFLVLKSIIICSVCSFFTISYTGFSSFKTEYIDGKQYKELGGYKPAKAL